MNIGEALRYKGYCIASYDDPESYFSALKRMGCLDFNTVEDMIKECQRIEAEVYAEAEDREARKTLASIDSLAAVRLVEEIWNALCDKQYLSAEDLPKDSEGKVPSLERIKYINELRDKVKK